MTRNDSNNSKINKNPSSINKTNNNEHELERFRLYFDMVNDSIIIFEIDNSNVIQNVIDVNSVTTQRLGYTREEIFDRKNWRRIARTIFRDFEKNVEFFIENNYVVFNSVAYTKENKEIPIEISVRSSKLSDRNIIVVIARDIVDRVELNKKLIKQKEELSEFAHTTAHNLKNPLIAINGYVKLLEKSYNEKYLEKITQLTKKMVEMVDKSLQLADSGTILGQLETIDLNMHIKNITDTIIPRDVDVEIEKLPKIKGDPTKVNILFENLLDNAISHGKAKNVKILWKTTTKFHKISIINDGKLFNSDAKENAFKKRFTTKTNGYGGHGLLIVQKIVDAHNWKIELESDVVTSIVISIPKKP
jgi:PAS domain S-box-containing protein